MRAIHFPPRYPISGAGREQPRLGFEEGDRRGRGSISQCIMQGKKDEHHVDKAYSIQEEGILQPQRTASCKHREPIRHHQRRSAHPRDGGHLDYPERHHNDCRYPAGIIQVL
jgi:hypothetical protein